MLRTDPVVRGGNTEEKLWLFGLFWWIRRFSGCDDDAPLHLYFDHLILFHLHHSPISFLKNMTVVLRREDGR